MVGDKEKQTYGAMNRMWKKWETDPPPSGTPVVILANDFCTAAMGLVILREGATEVCVLNAEDGLDMSCPLFFADAVWAELPRDYPLAFTQITPDDWR